MSKFNFPFSKSCAEARPLWLGFFFWTATAIPNILAQTLPWSQIQIAGLSAPKRPSGNDSGSVGWNSGALNVQLRCFSFRNASRFALVQAGLNYKAETFQGTGLRENHVSYRTTPFVSGIYLKDKHLMLSRVAVSLTSGQTGFRNTYAFPSANVSYTRNPFRNWGYTVGAGYSYIFGQGLAYPILGLHYAPKPGRKWQLILPLSLSYRIRHNRKWKSRFALHPSGGLRAIQTQAFSLTQKTQNLFLRTRALALSYGLDHQIGRNWIFSFVFSALRRRSVWITDADNIGLNPGNRIALLQPQKGWETEIRIRYRLFAPKKIISNQVPEIMDSDLDQISPQDLPDPDLMDTL